MTDFPFSTSDTQGVGKILTPPLPLPYMGGECLRTTLSLYTEMWSACEKNQNFKFQTSNIKNEKATLENYHRRTDRHPHVNRDYRWNNVVHAGTLKLR